MTDKKKNSFAELNDTLKNSLDENGMTLEDLVDQMAESAKQRPFVPYKPGTNPLTGEDWNDQTIEDGSAPNLDDHEPG